MSLSLQGYAIERLNLVRQARPTPEMFAGMLARPAITAAGESASSATPQWSEEACQACAHPLLGLMPRNPGRLLLT